MAKTYDFEMTTANFVRDFFEFKSFECELYSKTGQLIVKITKQNHYEAFEFLQSLRPSTRLYFNH